MLQCPWPGGAWEARAYAQDPSFSWPRCDLGQSLPPPHAASTSV